MHRIPTRVRVVFACLSWALLVAGATGVAAAQGIVPGVRPVPSSAVDAADPEGGNRLICAVGLYKILRLADGEGCRSWEEEVDLGGSKPGDNGDGRHPGRPVLVPIALEPEGLIRVVAQIRQTTGQRLIVEREMSSSEAEPTAVDLDLGGVRFDPTGPNVSMDGEVSMAARFEDGTLILERSGLIDVADFPPPFVSSLFVSPRWIVEAPFFIEVPYFEGIVTPVKLLATWNDRDADVTIGDFTVRAEGTIEDTGALFHPELGDIEILVAGDRLRFDFVMRRFDPENAVTEDREYRPVQITVEAFAVVPASLVPDAYAAD